MNLNKALDKAYEGKSLKELADAPIDALAGVSLEHGTERLEVGVNVREDSEAHEPLLLVQVPSRKYPGFVERADGSPNSGRGRFASRFSRHGWACRPLLTPPRSRRRARRDPDRRGA